VNVGWYVQRLVQRVLSPSAAAERRSRRAGERDSLSSENSIFSKSGQGDVVAFVRVHVCVSMSMSMSVSVSVSCVSLASDEDSIKRYSARESLFFLVAEREFGG
jgi:hypothetical protein